MTGVRAFVGHSFSDKDEEVVRKFTDFFDTLKNGSKNFDWVHATESRSEDVSEKVLELINGKNLFIGICTQNEGTVKEHNFRRSKLSARIAVREEDIEWKTSDWIIQETGLAIGRGMKLILLVEDGVRTPGGLQGNLEYISFNRAMPEKAFPSIMEMVNNLHSLGDEDDSYAAKSEPTSPVSQEIIEEDATHSLTEPNDSWELSDYRFGIIKGLLRGDEEYCQRVEKAYTASLGPQDTRSRAEWNAAVEYLKLKVSGEGDPRSLEKQALAHEDIAPIQAHAARAFLHFDDKQNAQKFFRRAIEKVEDDNEKIELLGELANTYPEDCDVGEVISIIDEMRALVGDPKTEELVLSKLRNLRSWYKDDLLRTALLEREISIDPTNLQKRFDLAYAHSENDGDVLSMYHYEKIPENKRNGTTWNNLGVIYQQLNMSAKSVEAYKKAADENETIAMGNLARLLLNAGFVAEASEYLRAAQVLPDFHDNIATSLVRLKEIPNEEIELHDEKLEDVNLVSEFLSHVGNHVWKATPTSLPSTMMDPSCELSISFDSGTFSAKGSYENDANSGVANALTGVKGTSQKERIEVAYNGRFVGGVIIGERTERKTVDGLRPTSLLDQLSKNKKFVIVFEEPGLAVRGMIGRKLTEFRFNDKG
ncbi:hypothetical protein [Aliiroseovarius marinus]|uniref:hypothetical protein n=1 Tax=Aliiroseovarius marinus TaxID=2500159 RepID=UPI003D7DB2A5